MDAMSLKRRLDRLTVTKGDLSWSDVDFEQLGGLLTDEGPRPGLVVVTSDAVGVLPQRFFNSSQPVLRRLDELESVRGIDGESAWAPVRLQLEFTDGPTWEIYTGDLDSLVRELRKRCSRGTVPSGLAFERTRPLSVTIGRLLFAVTVATAALGSVSIGAFAIGVPWRLVSPALSVAAIVLGTSRRRRQAPAPTGRRSFR